MMPSIFASREFSDFPDFEYICPHCGVGFLVPDKNTFKSLEPNYSKLAQDHGDWDPHYSTYRFTVTCVCTKKDCGEVAFVSGTGGVDPRYAQDSAEYYDYYSIKSFFPAPKLCQVPPETPASVEDLLKKSFLLYWVDTGAAANALRASLEALLDALEVPTQEKRDNGHTHRMSLHRRLEVWSETERDHAELCLALKEIGNIGSHGDVVSSEHYLGSLEIYSHVLRELFENNSRRMKELAQSIRDEIKVKNL